MTTKKPSSDKDIKLNYARELLTQNELSAFSADQVGQGAVEGAVALLSQMLELTFINEHSTIDGVVRGISGTSSQLSARTTILGLLSDSIEALSSMKLIAVDEGREHLCYCVFANQDCDLSLSEDIGVFPSLAGTILPIYPADLRAIVKKKLTILELTEYKLYRRLLLEKPDPETQFSDLLYEQFVRVKEQSGQSGPAERGRPAPHLVDGHTVDHPSLIEISQSLDANRGCLLVGPSSSGKTVLAEQMMVRQAARGDRVTYVNLSSQFGEFVSIYDALLSHTDDPQLCFILDDLQSNPSIAKYALIVISAWRRITTKKCPLLVGICWPEFARQAVVWFEDCHPFSVYPQQVRELLLRRADTLDTAIVDTIKSKYGDDLLLLSLFLSEALRTRQEPTAEAVAQALWSDRTRGTDSEQAKRVCLVVSALGRFDIAAPVKFAEYEARVESKFIDELINAGLIRKIGALISVGHRSLAGLLSDWISTGGTWDQLKATGGPASVENVVLRYLQSSDAALAIETLRGLQARVGFKKEDQLNVRAAAIVSIWQVFNSIVERLEVQQENDATWGRIPSSAMFAAQSFAAIGREKAIEGSLQFLRSSWQVEGGRIQVATTNFRTKDDFEKIRDCMLQEDKYETRWKSLGVAGDEVDMDKFHKTWVLGLILGSEAASRSPRLPLASLAAAVEQEAISSAAFYPQRVPWCTARVLLGLAACGRRIDTSAVVERCAKWLLRDIADGGACKSGVWESGTGTWNSTIETTAMVLVALTAVGVDWTTPALVSARSYLIANRAQWTATGKEMDGALALQAYLDTGGNWEDIAPEVQRLCQWGKAEAVWRGATRSSNESLEQSCRVAQIASHLIDIGWTAIRTDLPAFLDALATPRILWSEPAALENVQIASPTKAIGLRTQPDPELEALKGLIRINIAETTVVGDYGRFDERTRNELIDRVRGITRGLKSKNVVHENFLVWAAPGTGKSFLVQQIAKSLGVSVRYIEVNFASLSRPEIHTKLDEVSAATQPTLVLLDEIDARPTEPWLYDDTFSYLDTNLSASKQAVFVLIGSSPTGLARMMDGMKSRPKGKDLLDRVPDANRFEIPAPTIEDRVAIVAAQVSAIAKEKGVKIVGVEKLALYYALKNDGLGSPRQLRDLIQVAVLRIAGGDERLRYDHLFDLGDRRNQRFFTDHEEAAQELSSVYVMIA